MFREFVRILFLLLFMTAWIQLLILLPLFVVLLIKWKLSIRKLLILFSRSIIITLLRRFRILSMFNLCDCLSNQTVYKRITLHDTKTSCLNGHLFTIHSHFTRNTNLDRFILCQQQLQSQFKNTKHVPLIAE